MIDRRSQLMCFAFLVSDLALAALAWLGAYWLRFQSGVFAVHGEPPAFRLCLRNLPLLVLLALVAFRVAGQYDIGRLRRFREEMLAVLKGTALLTLFAMASVFFLQDRYESRLTMLLFCGMTASSILAARRTGWAIIRTLRARGYNQTFSLIVGTGRVARRLNGTLMRIGWLGIRNVGFVEDQVHPYSTDLDVLGGFDDLPELIRKYEVSHVFIALPFARYEDVRRVFSILSHTVVEVRLVPDVPSLAGLSLTTTNLDGQPLVGLRESPHYGLNVFIKRAMDVALASVALLVLSPLLAVVAVLVKLTSPGPIFYRQERCGLNGRPFWIIKFRSMRQDAEAKTGAVWAKQGDDRRTRFGSFIRATSIDELPQLWNVLTGDMSIVGPRPERPKFVEQFSRTIPGYMARHCVKAGITGWAQVHGWRGNTSLRKRIQYDHYYITHWTPWLDVRIMWMTIFKGIVHKNAY